MIFLIDDNEPYEGSVYMVDADHEDDVAIIAEYAGHTIMGVAPFVTWKDGQEAQTLDWYRMRFALRR